ncbi:MAG: ROK family protein [Alphaproteobacteria bacterium]
MMRAGVDLGGTKTEAIAMDARGVVRARVRQASGRSYEESLAVVHDVVAEIERLAGAAISSVGVGIPGSPSPVTGLIRNANSTWLNGRPFGEDLARVLARPTLLANDANCFALSEAIDGAGAGARAVFGVILGTGCGGGIVIDGRLWAGASGIAGEWGHTPLPWPSDDEHPGPSCWCGKTGCLETWISGPGFARDHARATGAALPPEAIIAACEAGDAGALGSYRRLVGRIARGLACVVNVIDPEVIVLGGGLSNIESLPEDVEAAMSGHVFSDAVSVRVVRNRHGDSSGVRGAAWLFS